MEVEKMTNKNFRHQYDEAFAVVQAVINEWDPIGLMAMDCPEDEYESEIQHVTTAAFRATTPTHLAEEIDAIFTKFFEGTYKKRSDSIEVAEKILAHLST